MPNFDVNFNFFLKDQAKAFKNYAYTPPKPPKIEGKFDDCVIKRHKTGSRYICNPPPTDTDDDTVILVNGLYDYETLLEQEGWVVEGEYDSEIYGFISARKGDQNYIITEDPDFYNCYVMATEGAKALNLLKKEDRITLFRAIMDAACDSRYGNVVDSAKFDWLPDWPQVDDGPDIVHALAVGD